MYLLKIILVKRKSCSPFHFLVKFRITLFEDGHPLTQFSLVQLGKDSVFICWVVTQQFPTPFPLSRAFSVQTSELCSYIISHNLAIHVKVTPLAGVIHGENILVVFPSHFLSLPTHPSSSKHWSWEEGSYFSVHFRGWKSFASCVLGLALVLPLL